MFLRNAKAGPGIWPFGHSLEDKAQGRGIVATFGFYVPIKYIQHENVSNLRFRYARPQDPERQRILAYLIMSDFLRAFVEYRETARINQKRLKKGQQRMKTMGKDSLMPRERPFQMYSAENEPILNTTLYTSLLIPSKQTQNREVEKQIRAYLTGKYQPDLRQGDSVDSSVSNGNGGVSSSSSGTSAGASTSGTARARNRGNEIASLLPGVSVRIEENAWEISASKLLGDPCTGADESCRTYHSTTFIGRLEEVAVREHLGNSRPATNVMSEELDDDTQSILLNFESFCTHFIQENKRLFDADGVRKSAINGILGRSNRNRKDATIKGNQTISDGGGGDGGSGTTGVNSSDSFNAASGNGGAGATEGWPYDSWFGELLQGNLSPAELILSPFDFLRYATLIDPQKRWESLGQGRREHVISGSIYSAFYDVNRHLRFMAENSGDPRFSDMRNYQYDPEGGGRGDDSLRAGDLMFHWPGLRKKYDTSESNSNDLSWGVNQYCVLPMPSDLITYDERKFQDWYRENKTIEKNYEDSLYSDELIGLSFHLPPDDRFALSRDPELQQQRAERLARQNFAKVIGIGSNANNVTDGILKTRNREYMTRIKNETFQRIERIPKNAEHRARKIRMNLARMHVSLRNYKRQAASEVARCIFHPEATGSAISEELKAAASYIKRYLSANDGFIDIGFAMHSINLSIMGNFWTILGHVFEIVYEFLYTHDIIAILWACSLSSGDPADGLRPNTMQEGEYATSKSWNFMKLWSMLVRSMVDVVTDETVNANSDNRSRDGGVDVYEEANEAWFVAAKGRPRGNPELQQWKAMLTRNVKVKHHAWINKDTGHKVNIRSVNSSKRVRHWASNDTRKFDKAMLSRMLRFYITKRYRPGIAISDFLTRRTNKEIEAIRQYTSDKMAMLHALTTATFTLERCGVIDSVNTSVTDALLQRVKATMEKHAFPEIEPRVIEMLMFVVRSVTIVRALLIRFSSPDSIYYHYQFHSISELLQALVTLEVDLSDADMTIPIHIMSLIGPNIIQPLKILEAIVAMNGRATPWCVSSSGSGLAPLLFEKDKRKKRVQSIEEVLSPPASSSSSNTSGATATAATSLPSITATTATPSGLGNSISNAITLDQSSSFSSSSPTTIATTTVATTTQPVVVNNANLLQGRGHNVVTGVTRMSLREQDRLEGTHRDPVAYAQDDAEYANLLLGAVDQKETHTHRREERKSSNRIRTAIRRSRSRSRPTDSDDNTSSSGNRSRKRKQMASEINNDENLTETKRVSKRRPDNDSKYSEENDIDMTPENETKDLTRSSPTNISVASTTRSIPSSSPIPSPPVLPTIDNVIPVEPRKIGRANFHNEMCTCQVCIEHRLAYIELHERVQFQVSQRVDLDFIPHEEMLRKIRYNQNKLIRQFRYLEMFPYLADESGTLLRESWKIQLNNLREEFENDAVDSVVNGTGEDDVDQDPRNRNNRPPKKTQSQILNDWITDNLGKEFLEISRESVTMSISEKIDDILNKIQNYAPKIAKGGVYYIVKDPPRKASKYDDEDFERQEPLKEVNVFETITELTHLSYNYCSTHSMDTPSQHHIHGQLMKQTSLCMPGYSLRYPIESDSGMGQDLPSDPTPEEKNSSIKLIKIFSNGSVGTSAWVTLNNMLEPLRCIVQDSIEYRQTVPRSYPFSLYSSECPQLYAVINGLPSDRPFITNSVRQISEKVVNTLQDGMFTFRSMPSSFLMKKRARERASNVPGTSLTEIPEAALPKSMDMSFSRAIAGETSQELDIPFEDFVYKLQVLTYGAAPEELAMLGSAPEQVMCKRRINAQEKFLEEMRKQQMDLDGKTGTVSEPIPTRLAVYPIHLIRAIRSQQEINMERRKTSLGISQGEISAEMKEKAQIISSQKLLKEMYPHDENAAVEDWYKKVCSEPVNYVSPLMLEDEKMDEDRRRNHANSNSGTRPSVITIHPRRDNGSNSGTLASSQTRSSGDNTSSFQNHPHRSPGSRTSDSITTSSGSTNENITGSTTTTTSHRQTATPSQSHSSSSSSRSSNTNDDSSTASSPSTTNQDFSMNDLYGEHYVPPRRTRGTQRSGITIEDVTNESPASSTTTTNSNSNSGMDTTMDGSRGNLDHDTNSSPQQKDSSPSSSSLVTVPPRGEYYHRDDNPMNRNRSGISIGTSSSSLTLQSGLTVGISTTVIQTPRASLSLREISFGMSSRRNNPTLPPSDI